MDGLLRLREVESLTKLSRATIERLERAGKVPLRRRVSARAVRSLAAEVDLWLRGEAEAAAHHSG